MQGFEFSADAAMNLVVDEPRGYASTWWRGCWRRDPHISTARTHL